MSDDDRSPEDPETGEPVAELAELRYDVSAGFPERVRRALDRRSLTGGLAFMLWHLPVAVILEFLTVLFGTYKKDSSG